MKLITAPLSQPERGVIEVLLPVDRHVLEKRRWRGVADDGQEFGFDLEEPLQDGAQIHCEGGASYIIAQRPEPVLEVALANPAESARLGWLIGNLHFSVEIGGGVVRVIDDPALRQLFERERVTYLEASRVFHPTRQGHVH